MISAGRAFTAMLLCCWVVGGAATSSGASGTTLAGHWEGSLEQHGQPLPISFDFTRARAGLQGRFTAERWRAMDYPLDDVKVDGDRVTFGLGDDALTGRLRGDTLTGSFKGDDGTGTFRLRRVARTPLPYDAIPVTFRNGPVVLAGTLAMPRTRGPHAAVVLLQGSGPEIRWGTNRFIADRFARAGIAALAYDKRGAGESGGDWRSARYDDLARDALAGVALLAARPDIDPARIGVHGHSEGAIVAPVAASLAPRRVAFIVAEATIAGRVRDQDLYRVTNDVNAKDWPAEDKRKALALYAAFLDSVSGDKPYSVFATASAGLQGEAWFKYLGLPPKGHWLWKYYPQRANFDTRAAWRGLKQPVLLVYGERDALVPVGSSIRRFEDIFDAGHEPYTALIVPRAQHNLTIHPLPGEAFFWWHAAPGAIDTVVMWVGACTTSPGSCGPHGAW